MFPQLNIYLDGSTEPVVVQTTSMDFWTYEELAAKHKTPNSEHGMRLTVAYAHIEGKDPHSFADVKAWAKMHKVQVALGESPDPTQPEVTGGS
jgi:hypothetical protein